jgi:alpha-1,2-mannosyltransferase
VRGQKHAGAHVAAAAAATPRRPRARAPCRPLHYALYGRGLQTWEYSPAHALRSWLYVLLHGGAPAFAAGAFWGADKIAVFHRLHALLALSSAAGEMWLVGGLAAAAGPSLARASWAALALSAGMTVAAPALLPSSWTMVGLCFAWGAWLRGAPAAGVAAAAAALLLGWPFAAVAAVPFALHVLATARWAAVVPAGAAAAAALCAACAAVDARWYGRLLLAPWNIIAYNALGVGGDGRGGDLYGVEPASFYARNLALNFNVQALAAALSPLALAAEAAAAWRGGGGGGGASRSLLFADAPAGGAARARALVAALLAQLWLWFALMSARPHKEERFMFVVFPLVSVAAAATALAGARALRAALVAAAPRARAARALPRAALVLAALATAALSASRVAALAHGYSAPFAAWTFLAREVQAAPAGEPSAPLAAHFHGRGDGSAWTALFLDTAPPLAALPAYAAAPRLLRARGAAPPAAPGAPAAVTVCVGKEWYRFPGSFFLPERARAPRGGGARGARGAAGPARLAFLESDFGGQLPQPFLPLPAGASAPRTGFNDVNAAERDRYVPLASCDYVVDSALPTPRSAQAGARWEPYFDAMVPRGGRPAPAPGASPPPCNCMDVGGASVEWRSLWSAPFVHADSSPALTRAFFIPRLSHARNAFATYHVLRRQPCSCAAQA